MEIKKVIWLGLIVLAFFACHKKPTAVSYNPNAPSYAVSAFNHSTHPIKFTFNLQEHALIAGAQVQVGNFNSGTYNWRAQRADGPYQVGSGQVVINQAKECRIYDDAVYWH